MITQSYKIDMTPGAVPLRVKVSQYDVGVRQLVFQLFNGAAALTSSSFDLSAQIVGTKPDKKGFEYSATVNATSSAIYVTVDITEQMTACAGDVVCEIRMYDSDNRISSANFILDVEQAALGSETDISETELPDIIDEARSYAVAAEDAAERAEQAAAGAVAGLELGKMTSFSDGVIVTDIDLHRAPVAGDRILFYHSTAVASPSSLTTYNDGVAVTTTIGDFSMTHPAGLTLMKYVALGESLRLQTVQDIADGGYTAGVGISINGTTINNSAPQLGDDIAYSRIDTVTSGALGYFSANVDCLVMDFRTDAEPYNGGYTLRLTTTGASFKYAVLKDKAGNNYAEEIPFGSLVMCKSNVSGTGSEADPVVVTVLEIGNTEMAHDVVYSAFNLLSKSEVAESVPYLYRRSGGAVRDVALEHLKKVVGASVAWNQKAYDNLTLSWQGITITNTNGIIDIDGTATGNVYVRLINDSDRPIVNHIYYVSTKNKQSGIIVYNNNNGITTSEKTAVIGKDVQGAESQDWYLRISSGTVCQHLKMAINIVDLTQMFGTAIADYIYSLEQATSGSGIAKLKEWGFFTKDYYAYNTGALQSVKTSGKKCVGKNLTEKVLQNVNINSSAVLENNYGYNLGLARIIQGMDYIITTDDPTGFVGGFFYDEPTIGSVAFDSTRHIAANKKFTAPITGYVVYRTTASYTTPQIEFGITATAYEPYTEKTYPLSNVELRGLFKLDSNNNLYADGDEYTPDGNVKRKYGIVDLGNLNWELAGGSCFLSVNEMPNVKIDTSISTPRNAICPYVWKKGADLFNLDDAGFSYYIEGGENRLFVKDLRYSDAATFTTAMNGVYLIYELATVTTEATTPYTEVMLVDGDGTEEFLDSRDIPVPVGHESGYNQAIKGLPTAPTADGNYKLRCTVTNGMPSFSWVSDT